ncbi:MoaD/ThiS family protein [Roseiconus lacunae]|uniref:Molybdopterin synthase sulfur carrier subunit n=2 Tax=Roseiconus lacunae TaxID=2605694 RepID=A0ABT7PJP7_9BACT|nr:MoaD/ThiS family protein [Roseiconus lacunae]MDM4016719.1 MoaD/ThiS family protein [Roseiconus lacunae]
MKLKVLLFAGLREAAQASSIEVEIKTPATANDVVDEVAKRLPSAATLIRLSRLAIDQSYVADDAVVTADAKEFALIPPVSGG